ncbi:hypothetical protein AT246_01045 [Bartonella henselae]|uniref:Hypothetical membrane protein n=1 Tax=Bartonella henselae TaxID=38323 RepID=X5M3M5_BARHN|nr:hypothetical protein [Bartonella henselae]MDM9996069.1 hypothetical protein [Bartonella henselae]OLL48492.1 hypothetical protein AT241_03370 [Bartonella henselae]OLL48820.1 hypothetical protein AT247_01590 [Bartonella henselae]OLL49913.1 hypothetical protein AT243_01885 [Bartonella henselae]OLL57467.1 hypothetical protein AT246_01045 [Bartonella henselae]
MKKVLRNQLLSILTVSVFFLSQVANVHANYLENNSQAAAPISVVEQGNKKTINMATFYIPSLNHGTENAVAFEGKVEKVVDVITLGIGIMSAGYIISTVISWISQIISFFK